MLSLSSLAMRGMLSAKAVPLEPAPEIECVRVLSPAEAVTVRLWYGNEGDLSLPLFGAIDPDGITIHAAATDNDELQDVLKRRGYVLRQTS